jgi:hypothetical protein
MKSVNQYSSQVGFPQVKDTLEVLDFGFKFMNAVTESLADGKVNLLDIPSVLSPLMAAGAAVDGFQNVKNELLTLDPIGKSIINEFVTERFDVRNDQVELLIEETITSTLNIVSIGLKWADFRVQN